MSARLLVTGSRDWEDKETLAFTLAYYVQGLRDKGFEVIVVHGDCPTGADALAKSWCVKNHVKQEPHPAAWKTHGKAAGPIRNAEMVELDADLCLAFAMPCKKKNCWLPGYHYSHGTNDTVLLARNAKIPTTVLRGGIDGGTR